MASVKLYYYQVTGRGNQIRLALAAADIPFQDVHPASGFPPRQEEKEAWRQIGGNTTTNIPMLQFVDNDGKEQVYTQSHAVLKAVGRRGNLMPAKDDDEGQYMVDKLIADAEDLRSAAYKSFVPWGASEQDAEDYINKIFPLHANNFERQLKLNLEQNGTGSYFVGKDTLTIADITVYDVIVNFGTNRFGSRDVLDKFGALKKWIGRIEANERIAIYLASEEYGRIGNFGPSTLGL